MDSLTPGKADKGTGTGRGRPRGPRAPSARDLAHTPEITQYYGPEQPPLAPVFQQDTGGGVGHVGGEQQEVDTDASVNDLAEDAASSSNVVTSLSTHTNAASSEQTCSGLDAIVAAYDSDEDTRAPSSNNNPSYERPLSHPLPPKTGTLKDRMQELRDVWTFKVRQGQSGPRSTASTSYETVVLEDGLIEKLDNIKKKGIVTVQDC